MGGAYTWNDDISDGTWIVLPIVNAYNLDDLLSESNYHVALRVLMDADADNVAAGHLKSWATNLDLIEVRAFGEDDEPTRAAVEAFDLCSALEDYPVLDEMDFSERETEYALSCLADDFPRFVWEFADEDDAPAGLLIDAAEEQYLASDESFAYEVYRRLEYPTPVAGGGLESDDGDIADAAYAVITEWITDVRARCRHHELIGDGQTTLV